jgi:hypothetical protein
MQDDSSFITTPSSLIHSSSKQAYKPIRVRLDHQSERSSRYLICLTIAPAFLTAAIYLCLGRIVVAYGQNISRMAPRLYTIIFVTCDFV